MSASLTSPAYVSSPTVAPTYANDQTATNPAYGVGQVLQGFAPQSAASTNTLNDTLAAMGISGGGAANAQTALQGQLASSLAPTLGNVYTQYAGNSLQQALANQNAANTASLANQSTTMAGNEYNAGAYNSLQQALMNAAQGYQSQEAGGVGSLYGDILSGFGSLYGEGLSGENALAGIGANAYPVYGTSGYGDLGTGLGSYLGGLNPFGGGGSNLTLSSPMWETEGF